MATVHIESISNDGGKADQYQLIAVSGAVLVTCNLMVGGESNDPHGFVVSACVSALQDVLESLSDHAAPQSKARSGVS